MAAPPKRATLADVAKLPNRTELVGAVIVQLPLFGVKPGRIRQACRGR